MSKFITIKDKFDTESAKRIVDMGYPNNKEYLHDIIFWSCFPNDPVCHITYPFLSSLSDEELAGQVAEFLELNLEPDTKLIENVFYTIINPRGEKFRKLIVEQAHDQKVKDLFGETELMINESALY